MTDVPQDTIALLFERIKSSVRCSKCGGPRDLTTDHRYCRPCHATQMREWRNSHPLTYEQRMKDNARSYAGVYLRRGKLTRQPCKDCGSSDSQMHHDDYTKPLQVTWLCRPCHLARHSGS